MSSTGRFFTTEPPGKHFPIFFFLKKKYGRFSKIKEVIWNDYKPFL